MPKNVLFIMCDQLRWDYLSCTGHPHLHTPHIDRLAARGVLFERTYVQSPICGPSRMSFYTGRYVSSHGATWNNIPLKVGEMTLGDDEEELVLQTAELMNVRIKATREDGQCQFNLRVSWSDPDAPTQGQGAPKIKS